MPRVELARKRFNAAFVDIGGQNPRALKRQRARGCGAEPPGGAGDQDDLALRTPRHVDISARRRPVAAVIPASRSVNES